MRRLGDDSPHSKDGDYAKNAPTVIGDRVRFPVPRLQPFPLDRDMTDDNWFPNGLPRLVMHYEVRDGIKYVMDRVGEYVPVLDDHWIMVDTKKMDVHVVNHFFPTNESRYDPSSAIRIDMVSDYHSTDEEAMFAAECAQKRLENQEGRFIPIFHRD